MVSTRLAVIDDAEAIAAAHVRAWQEAYDGIVPADHLDSLDPSLRAEHWRENLRQATLPDGTPSPTNLVVESDDQVVGFACVGRWRHAVDDLELGELWAMYVHPDHWGTGAGWALMTHTEAILAADRVTTAYLWVLEDNALARRFYERQGWHADDVTEIESIAGVELVSRRYSRVLEGVPAPTSSIS